MRPRTEVAIGLAALAVVVVVAASLGRDPRQVVEADQRRSSYLAGPAGARGLAEALARLQVKVSRTRGSLRQLHAAGTGPDHLVAILDPDYWLDPDDARLLADFQADSGGGASLLLAGRGASAPMQCFGYAVDRRLFDSAQVVVPGASVEPRAPWVDAVLAAREDSEVTDSTERHAGRTSVCAVAEVAAADTLLLTTTGRLVAVRLNLADSENEVVLVADGSLFSNIVLRRSPLGPYLLGILVGRYRSVAFDESVHGFGHGGSLAGATFEWSRQSPLGWAAWQVVLVGLLALVAGGVRFGPIESGIPRQRRSPLEHVRALATALSAARGHDVAVGSLIQGLRRRLLPPGQRARGDWRAWVEGLPRYVRGPAATAAVETLTTVMQPGQPSGSVLRAANAVEDVWEELRP